MQVRKTLKLKYFLSGVVVASLLSSTIGYALLYRSDERELQRIKQTQTLSADTAKVKHFILSRNPKLWDSLASEVALSIVDAASTYKIPLDIMVGISWVEAKFEVFALSSTGAQGLTQVDFKAWKEELGNRGNVYDPKYNVPCGAFVLSKMLKHNSMKNALQLYNLGEGNYKSGMRNPGYVAKVMETASEFRYTSL